MTIGLIGYGFLGSTLHVVFKEFVDFKIYDKNKSLSIDSLESAVNDSDIIFVCVPTPMKLSDNSCDISIIEEVLEKISSIKKEKAVVIRSTVAPGTIKLLSEKYDLILFHMPEFLTERNAIEDFKNQKAIILGHDGYKNLAASEYYKKLIEDMFIGARNRNLISCEGIYHTKTINSELCKYFSNTFLATKVLLFNEYYFISKNFNADFNEIKEMMLLDQRIGESHTNVPGWDKDFGIGGSCFPKDSYNYIEFSRKIKFPSLIVAAAMKLNEKIRKNKDWLQQIGRIVVNK